MFRGIRDLYERKESHESAGRNTYIANISDKFINVVKDSDLNLAFFSLNKLGGTKKAQKDVLPLM